MLVSRTFCFLASRARPVDQAKLAVQDLLNLVAVGRNATRASLAAFDPSDSSVSELFPWCLSVLVHYYSITMQALTEVSH